MACDLRIPWPLWAENGDPKKEEENYRSIERWADNLLKNCLPASGAAVYCYTGSETLLWFSNIATRNAITARKEITLTQRSTVAVSITGWFTQATYNARGSMYCSIPEVTRQSYSVEFASNSSAVDSAFSASWSSHFAVTLDAGTYTFDPYTTLTTASIPNSTTTTVYYQMNFVVGTNTEDDCTETPST